MIKKLLLPALAVLAFGGAYAADPYKVLAQTGADNEGAMAFLVNFDTGEKVDSVLIDETGLAKFEGQVDEPYLARLIIDGARAAQFIVENGSIAVSGTPLRAFGSPLNDAFRQVSDTISAFGAEARTIADEAAFADLEKRYDAFVERTIAANSDNPIGYVLFLEQASALDAAALDEYVKRYPSFAQYERVKKVCELSARKAATSEGGKYVDFDINGQKLSQWVGRDGKYLLVDFFASWCGPCIRQLPVLKEIYAEHSDKLNVLGVAVWDEPDASRRAIADHQLPWDCIIDAQAIPTDLYGISGIPCIMLISPDGTILSRDKQSEELKAAVREALK